MNPESKKKLIKWLKRIALAILVILILIVPLQYVFIKLTNAPKLQTPGVINTQHPEKAVNDELFIMSINLAHGRANGNHQLRQSNEELTENLDDVAHFLNQHKPDIVALQEADQSAFWSGSFNHVGHIAEKSSYSYFLNGTHMQGLGLNYGTGFLSNIKAEDHLVYTFDSSYPTPSKGFTLYQLSLQDCKIDIISVHLDYAKGSVRLRQKDEIVALLKERGNAAIIIGDLNSDWHQNKSIVQSLVTELKLKTHEPEATDIVTFPLFKSRIDWILISEELEMAEFKVYDATSSDH